MNFHVFAPKLSDEPEHAFAPSFRRRSALGVPLARVPGYLSSRPAFCASNKSRFVDLGLPCCHDLSAPDFMRLEDFSIMCL